MWSKNHKAIDLRIIKAAVGAVTFEREIVHGEKPPEAWPKPR